jgi:hypothetical protein
VTDSAWLGGLRLRTASDEPPALLDETGERSQAPSGQPLAVRSARKDGREVATLRCFEESPNEFVIECEVYPVSKMVIEPLHPGPYRFGSMREASAFIDETAICLKYLGCDVA